MFARRQRTSQKKTPPAPSSQAIQCAVGFEVEVKNWNTWKPVMPEVLFESFGRYKEEYRKAHSKKDLLFKGKDFDLTADRPTEDSVPEFVTKPFAETPEGLDQMREVFRRIQGMLHSMHAKALEYPERLQSINRFAKEGKVVDPEASIDALEQPDLHPQANVGIRLGSVPELFERSGRFPAKRKADERLTRIKYVNTPEAQAEMRSMVRVKQRVLDAIERFRMWYEPYPDWEPSETFIGLCCYLAHYLDCPMINFKTYTKSAFPIMARTDFAAMYELLPPQEFFYFQLGGGIHFQTLFELIRFESNGDMPLDLKNQIFEKGTRQDQDQPLVDQINGLSRENWLLNITQGMDLLTERNYPGLDDQADELDTLGSWGETYDRVGTQPKRVPILELRRIQYVRDIDELSAVADDIFHTVLELNGTRMPVPPSAEASGQSPAHS
ncbi:hypothetical protein FUAX_51040 (plasmid) [Fulvitalea axinellae]|uniref:Uncharacterized protein n=1 Tax=Fulvitalea axinellae TaxID=1182444 RepID=A0AAU9CXZ1_9BACT|nr:hypothetical protein FUAX_51040 [Fulvitalea axinellae]